MVEKLTTEDFKNKIFDFENEKEWVFLGSKPVILDFMASWCNPCKQIAPILETLSEEYDGKIDIFSINVEDEPALAKSFSVKSVPSILFIPMDGQPQMMVGGLPKQKFEAGINEILKITK